MNEEGKLDNNPMSPRNLKRRGCTDVFCCFLFLLFTAGWVVVAAIGVMWGDPERLLTPTDSFGRRCGTMRPNSYNYTTRPYLLYFDITKCISYATALGGCQTSQVCVEKCPSEYFSYLQLQSVSPAEFQSKVYSNLYCADNVDKSTITSFPVLRQLVQSKQCISYTVNSAPVLGRCIPQAIIGAADKVNDLQKTNISLDVLRNMFGDDGGMIPQDYQIKGSQVVVGAVVDGETSVLTKMVHDLSKSWWQVLTLIISAGVLAFVWTVIMRLLGSLMIWTSILVLMLGLLGGCGYSWLKWNALVKQGAVDDFSFQPMFSVYFEMPTTWLVVAIILSVMALIFVFILLFVRKQISIAVALIEESSRAIGNMMSTLLFPLFPFALHILVFALWGTITIWVSSSGQENCRRVPYPGALVTNTSSRCDCALSYQDTTCVFVTITKDEDIVFWLQVYNLFAFFWMTCFVAALGDIALAGAFASHYWALDKSKDLPSFPVLRALGRAIRYNMGSLAFGSLIIAIIKIIRVLLEYFEEKFGKSENAIIKNIFLALKCCFWCMEVFFRFLTKNAYIMMAIYGRGFFTSAKDSFFLLSRNIRRTVVVNQVAGLLLFIGKAMITIGMGVVAFFFFSGQWVVEGIPRVDLYYYFVPIVIVVIGSYFIADLFFDVYEMAVDTTFICFLEDSEQNDGSAEKPFFMSRRLQEILGKSNDSTVHPK
ncbi:unnamed protein product [Auanema sp. JU1783]|nr:unnamed protein product [Auanema sp. JU1783]